jgi:hypothetical protein
VEAVVDEEEDAEVLGQPQHPHQQRPRQPMRTHPQQRPPHHAEQAVGVVDAVEILRRSVQLHLRRLQRMAL